MGPTSVSGAFLAAAAVLVVAMVCACLWRAHGPRDHGAYTQLEEGFSETENASASGWLRQGVRALGQVPSLRLPSQDAPGVEVETVDVERSIVWRDTLQSTRDALFVSMDADSDADLVVNEQHPYAHYFLEYDLHLQRLKTAGRHRAIAALLSEAPDKYLRHVFRHIEFRKHVDKLVYTLEPSFATDKAAARAAYDMLFAVATMRACVLNGEIVDNILSALSDHKEVQKRNQRELDRIRSRARQDIADATSALRNQYSDEDLRLRSAEADMGANLAALQGAHRQLGQRSVLGHTRRQSLKDVSKRNDSALAKTYAEIVRTESVLDDKVVRRSGVQTDLDTVRARLSQLTSRSDAERAAYARESEKAETERARLSAAARRMSTDMSAADRAKAQNLARAESSGKYSAKNAAAIASARARIDQRREAANRAASDIADARKRALDLKQTEAELAAKKARAAKSARLTKSQMDAKLRESERESSQLKSDYALWDRYAGLARLADELNANDDGLPGGS